MKKLKKSSNKKFNAIFIYGPIASGKLTIARILEKKLGYKLAHNHHINDFVVEIFDRNSVSAHSIKDELRVLVIKTMAEAKMNFIVTHCYSHDFVSKAGLSDPKYLKIIEKIIQKESGNFYPVFLKVAPEELLKRVNQNSRKEFKKLTDEKILKKWLVSWDIKNYPKIKNNFVLENTGISPQKAAELIIKHFELQ